VNDLAEATTLLCVQQQSRSITSNALLVSHMPAPSTTACGPKMPTM